MTDETQNQTQAEEAKLYAGKFKTVEALEEGYKNSLPIFQENETLKQKLQTITEVPVDYLKPDDIEIDEARFPQLKERAKEAGLTQEQFNKFARDDHKRVSTHKASRAENEKALGEETLNVLKNYVEKYPEGLRQYMLDALVNDKTARAQALAHRQQLLNSQTGGMSGMTAPGSYAVSEKDIKKAYDEKEANPSNMRARDHYMKLLETRAAQRNGVA